MKKEIILISDNRLLALCLGMYLSLPIPFPNTIRIRLFKTLDEFKNKSANNSISPDLIIFAYSYSCFEQIGMIKESGILNYSAPLILVSSFINNEINSIVENFNNCSFIFKTEGYTVLLKEKTNSILQFEEFNDLYSA